MKVNIICIDDEISKLPTVMLEELCKFILKYKTLSMTSIQSFICSASWPNLQTFKFDRSKETYDAAHKLIDNGTIVGCLKKCKNIQDIFRSLFRFKIF